MPKTELWNRRPSPKEVVGHLAALALNVVNLVHPDPATYAAAGAMTLTTGTLTGLEVANLTTPEKGKKFAALLEGVGAMVANRGAAMTALGIATHNSDLWMPGFITFQAGVALITWGWSMNRKIKPSS